MWSAQREVSRDGAARGRISRYPSQSERLEEIVSWIIGCRKYASAGENSRHRRRRKERHSSPRRRKKKKLRSLISPIPPYLACPRARRISYALAYFVSPNAGLVVVHGTSGTTKTISNFSVYKLNLPTYSSMQVGPGLNSSCSMNSKHLVLMMSSFLVL